MPLFALDDTIRFPPVHLSLPDGLLAMGGDLSVERLIEAYRNGIFPWFEDDIPLWWCPDPRFVLFPAELKVSKSMHQMLKHSPFHFTINTAFDQVIRYCKNTQRPGQSGTWITDEVENAFLQMHQHGFAFSAETWNDEVLAGGLYGIRMGNIFFGESMFSHQNNASKYAFINYVRLLQSEGVVVIDCQVYTPHLESLGARMIPRHEFIKFINENID